MNDTGQQNIADPLFTLECPNGQPIKTWIFRAFSPEIVLVLQTTDTKNKKHFHHGYLSDSLPQHNAKYF